MRVLGLTSTRLSLTKIGLIRDRVDLDRLGKRRADRKIAFKRNRWCLLLLRPDLTGHGNRRCLRSCDAAEREEQ